MDKIITSQAHSTATVSTTSPPKVQNAISFADLLNSYTGPAGIQQNEALFSQQVMQTRAITPAEVPLLDLLDYSMDQGGSTFAINTPISPNNKLPDSSATLVSLGVLNGKAPTVSHLLKAHPALQGEVWNILSTAANREKDFTGMPVGTLVQFDPGTKEISFRHPSQIQMGNENSIPPATSGAGHTSKAERNTTVDRQVLSPENKEPVLIGTLDDTNPTVSHLLAKHPDLKNDARNFIYSNVNRNKAFNHIAKGTAIHLQPETGEITWGSGKTGSPVSERSNAANPEIIHRHNSVSDNTKKPSDLVEAVQPFLGKSYKEIDCYELLVKGLRRMDIPYAGKDGLFTKLNRMARDEGKPANAYLNGEGIVEAVGSLVLSKKYPNMSNWQQKADSLFNEMKPLLRKGQILSFSTEKRGHTGIVSQQNQQWTFLNSGRLDNPVAVNSRQRGVGEEILYKEINNWFELSHNKKETLTITLGRLEQANLRTALNGDDSLSTQI